MRARGGSALRRCKQQLEQEQADEQAAQDENLAWRAQKRLWRHDQTASTLLRQDSRQRGKKGAISRPQQGSSLLPSEHNELMSQDEQFDVFGELAAAAADHHPQHSREGEIGERKEHAPMLPSPATKRSKSESVARPSAAELRSPQRSGTRARANLQTSANRRRGAPNRDFETPRGPTRSVAPLVLPR